jgi:hypothetical protein
VVAGIAKHGGQIGRGIGRHADDIGRGIGRNADDFGRGFARHGDDLGRGFGQQADDVGRGFGQHADPWGGGRWPYEVAPKGSNLGDDFGRLGIQQQGSAHASFPKREVAIPIEQAAAPEHVGEGMTGSLIHAGSRIVREVTKQNRAQQDEDPKKQP